MVRAKPKLGAAGYWIPDFLSEISKPEEREQIRKEIRNEFTADLGKIPPEGFFEAVEDLTAHFIVGSEYKKTQPKLANIKAELAELEGKTRDLLERLTDSRGIDIRTRQIIHQAWVLRGNSGDPLKDCEKPIMDLWAAIKETQWFFKEEIPPGRPVDTKRDFVFDLFELFQRFGLKPKTTRYGSFEQCCITLLHVATRKEPNENNIHRLILAATKQPRTT